MVLSKYKNRRISKEHVSKRSVIRKSKRLQGTALLPHLLKFSSRTGTKLLVKLHGAIAYSYQWLFSLMNRDIRKWDKLDVFTI